MQIHFSKNSPDQMAAMAGLIGGLKFNKIGFRLYDDNVVVIVEIDI